MRLSVATYRAVAGSCVAAGFLLLGIAGYPLLDNPPDAASATQEQPRASDARDIADYIGHQPMAGSAESGAAVTEGEDETSRTPTAYSESVGAPEPLRVGSAPSVIGGGQRAAAPPIAPPSAAGPKRVSAPAETGSGAPEVFPPRGVAPDRAPRRDAQTPGDPEGEAPAPGPAEPTPPPAVEEPAHTPPSAAEATPVESSPPPQGAGPTPPPPTPPPPPPSADGPSADDGNRGRPRPHICRNTNSRHCRERRGR